MLFSPSFATGKIGDSLANFPPPGSWQLRLHLTLGGSKSRGRRLNDLRAKNEFFDINPGGGAMPTGCGPRTSPDECLANPEGAQIPWLSNVCPNLTKIYKLPVGAGVPRKKPVGVAQPGRIPWGNRRRHGGQSDSDCRRGQAQNGKISQMSL